MLVWRDLRKMAGDGDQVITPALIDGAWIVGEDLIVVLALTGVNCSVKC